MTKHRAIPQAAATNDKMAISVSQMNTPIMQTPTTKANPMHVTAMVMKPSDPVYLTILRRVWKLRSSSINADFTYKSNVGYMISNIISCWFSSSMHNSLSPRCNARAKRKPNGAIHFATWQIFALREMAVEKMDKLPSCLKHAAIKSIWIHIVRMAFNGSTRIYLCNIIIYFIYWYTHFSTPVYSMQYKWLKCIYVMYPNTLWYFIYTSVWFSVKHYPLLQDFHVFPSGHPWVDRRSCSICAGSWKARANAMPANEATRMLSLDILQHASNNLNKFHILVWIVFS